jgi:hypothetical protein
MDQHVPAVGPVAEIKVAQIKTAKDTVDVLDLIPKLCGGVVKFDVQPIYTQVRTKKLLTTTEDEDKQAGFPAVQFYVEYTDKEGGHTDSYKTTESVTLGEYNTWGQILCAPQSMAYQLSVWAAIGVMGFLAIVLWVVNIIYAWKIWDTNAKNFEAGLDPTDKRFSDVGAFFARFASWVSSPVFKFFMAIMAAAVPFATAFVDILFYFFVIAPGSKMTGTESIVDWK